MDFGKHGSKIVAALIILCLIALEGYLGGVKVSAGTYDLSLLVLIINVVALVFALCLVIYAVYLVIVDLAAKKK
jgi:hypothetical protein